MKMSKQAKRNWRNRFIFLTVVAVGIIAYVIYINSATIYDFSHLTRTMDFGDSREFVPLTGVGEGRVPEMVRAAETAYIALYINPEDTTFAVHDKRNGAIWHSAPQGEDAIASVFHQGVMRSNMGFSFYDQGRRQHHRWMYPDSAVYGPDQFTISSISKGTMQGVRIEYVVGNLDLGIHALPRFLPEDKKWEMFEYFETINPSEARFFRLQWRESEEHEGFMRLNEAIMDHVVNTTRMLALFALLDWTLEQTHEYNAKVNYVPEISFDFFYATFEIMIDRDRLIVNVPIDEIRPSGDTVAMVYAIDVLRFFGAGCAESEGFMLVPSGAGGLIEFNNGRYRISQFEGPVYGVDTLHTVFFPQNVQPIRLPVFGIQNNGFGMLAHIYSGQALATVNAGVAAETAGVGGTTAQNNAWFNFHLRSSMALDMGGIPGGAGDMYVIQDLAYTGDVTVMYHFLPQPGAGVGEMAQAYQQFLVEQGALTPLDGPGDRSFYLDILGAVDIRRLFLGTPYNSIEIMTTMEDANRIVGEFNAGGVNTIQMQWHGWFNRGINHDVAKRVNPIRGVGTQREMQDMNARLQANGGGLHPVVNFQLTNYYSRNFNRTHESARDPAGYFGFKTRVARDMMFTRGTHHLNDWFILVHPGMMPFHVERFLPNFERRVGIDGLALADMGDILTESAHRRNPVDREHSRLIAEEQMGIIQNAIPNLVVFGGNDYSLPFASHLVGVPTETDRFFILDYEVPFFPMVMHGFVEFAGIPANMRENFDSTGVLLNSMATGASPRYILTSEPTRRAEFSPHERFYSTHYLNWVNMATDHYRRFNDVYRNLRAERIVGFEVLSARSPELFASEQVTVTIFSNGTRIYVNHTHETFEHNGVIIPPRWFEVRGA